MRKWVERVQFWVPRASSFQCLCNTPTFHCITLNSSHWWAGSPSWPQPATSSDLPLLWPLGSFLYLFFAFLGAGVVVMWGWSGEGTLPHCKWLSAGAGQLGHSGLLWGSHHTACSMHPKWHDLFCFLQEKPESAFDQHLNFTLLSTLSKIL